MSVCQKTLKSLTVLLLAACTATSPLPQTHSPIAPQIQPRNPPLFSAVTGQIQGTAKADHVTIKVMFNAGRPGFKTQHLELSKIAKLKGWVKGSGIANQIWNVNGFVAVTGGTTHVQISGIPKGTNRVVSVQGYDANDVAIPGAQLKAVYSSPGTGNQVSVTLTWYSSATAQILEQLIDNSSPMAATLDVAALQTALDIHLYNGTTHIKPGTPGQTYSEFSLHPKWLDPTALATAIEANGGTLPAGALQAGWLLPKANPHPDIYVRTAENVNFKSEIAVQLTDPASAPGTIPANNDMVTMSDIVAGTWQIIAKIDGLNGGVSARSNLTVQNDGTTVFTAGTTGNPIQLGPVITQINGTVATADDQGSIGNTIAFTGDGFNIANQVVNNSVDFGGTAGTISGGNGLGTLLNVTIPAQIFGIVKVSFTTGTLKGNEADFKVVPTIANFAPGGAAEGEAITVTGTGFDPTAGNNTISINGIPAMVTAATNTTLTVTVPVGATTGKITATTTGGTAQSTQNFIVNTVNAPTIANFNPANGIIGVAPTTTVTINGTHFDPTPGNNTVRFNGVQATVNTASATVLTVTVPLLATTGKMTVETANGLATSATDFTVDSSVYTIAGTAGILSAHGIAIDGDGNLYVSDNGNHKILKLVPQANGTYTMSLYAGIGTAGAADGDRLTTAQFQAAEDVVVDTNGDIYVADTGNSAIRKITAATGVVSTLANTVQGLKAPEGVELGLDGKVYFTDNVTTCTLFLFGVCFVNTLTHARVYQMNKDGTGLVAFAGNTAGDAPGTGTAAAFKHMEGIVVNRTTGDLYVADTENHKIKKITVPGAVVTDYVVPPVGFVMHEIGMDAAGNVYIPGEAKHQIYKVNATTQAITSIAGTGVAGFNEGAASSALFNSPRDVAIDNHGNCYIADISNARIRKLTP